MLTDLRQFHGRRVRVWWAGMHAPIQGEFRGVWADAVPYFPQIECPAVWITATMEHFIPVALIDSIETADLCERHLGFRMIDAPGRCDRYDATSVCRFATRMLDAKHDPATAGYRR